MYIPCHLLYIPVYQLHKVSYTSLYKVHTSTYQYIPCLYWALHYRISWSTVGYQRAVSVMYHDVRVCTCSYHEQTSTSQYVPGIYPDFVVMNSLPHEIMLVLWAWTSTFWSRRLASKALDVRRKGTRGRRKDGCAWLKMKCECDLN